MVEDRKEKRIMGREAGKVEGRQTTNGATASEGEKSGSSISEIFSRVGSLQFIWRSGLVM